MNYIQFIAALITICGVLYAIYKWIKDHKGPKKILFIDDEIKDFEIVKILEDNGYSITTLEDVDNILDYRIKEAKIIFVDFKGVGRKFDKKEQGISVIKALKKKYKNKKKVILFSAHSDFDLSYDISVADANIPKNAPAKDFMDLIDEN